MQRTSASTTFLSFLIKHPPYRQGQKLPVIPGGPVPPRLRRAGLRVPDVQRPMPAPPLHREVITRAQAKGPQEDVVTKYSASVKTLWAQVQHSSHLMA